jgi:hypothetical protein
VRPDDRHEERGTTKVGPGFRIELLIFPPNAVTVQRGVQRRAQHGAHEIALVGGGGDVAAAGQGFFRRRG